VVTSFFLEVRNGFSCIKSSTFQWPLSEYKTAMDWTVKVNIPVSRYIDPTYPYDLQVSLECDDSIEAVALSLRPDHTKDPVIMSHFVTFQNSEQAAISSLKIVNESHPPAAIMESINKSTSLAAEYDAQEQPVPNTIDMSATMPI